MSPALGSGSPVDAPQQTVSADDAIPPQGPDAEVEDDSLVEWNKIVAVASGAAVVLTAIGVLTFGL